MIRPNPHLEEIRRDSDIIRGRDGLVCLDRNERASAFSDAELAEMLGGVTSKMLTTYPNLGPLYERLQRLTGLGEDRIAVGAGSDGLIRRTFQAFIQPGDMVVAPQPSYGMYTVWSRVFQAEFQGVPYGEGPDFTFDVDQLVEKIKAGARICCIANPDQPTGSVLSLDSLRTIAKACEEASTLLLIDEAYYPFYPQSAIELLDEFYNVLISRTFSKSEGIPGMRIGYALGAPNVIQALHTVRSPGEVNAIGAAVAVHLLDHPEMMKKFLEDIENGRKLLISAAENFGFEAPNCPANFQLLKCPAHIDPDDMFEELKARGYLIKAGFDHPGLKKYIRVSLDGPVIMEPFVHAMNSAMNALNNANKPA